MIHGNIGYLDAAGLILPLDVIRPLSIVEGTAVWALYYPRPSEYPDDVDRLHDLMLTPIPPEFWPALGRLTVRLVHQPGALKALASTLRDAKASILIGECTRTGHRYGTYSMVISLDDLRVSAPETASQPQRSVLERLASGLATLRARVLAECRDALFVEPEDPELVDAVDASPLGALPWFHDRRVRQAADPGAPLGSTTPMELRYKGGRFVPEKDFARFLKVTSRDPATALAPSFAFASLDLRSANIRVALFPEQHAHHFFLAEIHYERVAPSYSSRGLLSHTLSHLRPQYSVWRAINISIENSRELEEGQVLLFLQDRAGGTAKDVRTRAEACIHGLRGQRVSGVSDDPRDGSDTLITHSMVSALHRGVIEALMNTNDLEGTAGKDVFISYSQSDASEAKELKDDIERRGLTAFLADDDMLAGDVWSDRLRDELRAAKEVWTIISQKSQKSAWVKRETYAAWVLKKDTKPILLGVSPEKLDTYLSARHACTWAERHKLIDAFLATHAKIRL